MKYSWFLIFFAAINSAIGNVLIKKSQTKYTFLDSIFSVEFISGCVFYGLNLLLFAYALKNIDVTKAYPVLSGLGFLILSIIGYFYLGEKLSIINYSGISLVIIGIILIVYK